MTKKNLESDILLVEKEIERLTNQRLAAKKKLKEMLRRSAKMEKQRKLDELTKIATPLLNVLSVSEMEALLKRAAEVKRAEGEFRGTAKIQSTNNQTKEQTKE